MASAGDGNGTALQAASDATHYDVVKLLLEYKADPNILGENVLFLLRMN